MFKANIILCKGMEIQTKIWYLNDSIHREDGPAIICLNGTEEYFLNGVRHRDDGPAIVDLKHGYGVWFKNGKRLKASLI